MAIHDLQDALKDELKDLLSAEQQISAALPKMAQHATDPTLREAFETHLDKTNGQIGRLLRACQEFNLPEEPEQCEAIAGIIAEGEELLQKSSDPAVKDALLVAAAQKVEHYEMASYGSACAWAELLGHGDVSALLQETLKQEKKTDVKLTELANRVNSAATPS